MRRTVRTVYDSEAVITAHSSPSRRAPGDTRVGCYRSLASAADALGEALHFLELRGAFYCRSEFMAPFGLELPPLEGYPWV